MPKLRLPWECHGCLTEERLTAIGQRLLEVRHNTIRQLSGELDDDYVRETAVFGRSRLMLIGMALNSQFPWLRLASHTFDVTAEIEGIPFRFFRDDPNKPEKLNFFRRNLVDDLFDTDDTAPVLWRFVIERTIDEDAEDMVHFVGYNVYQERVAHWTLTKGAAARLSSVDRDVPPSKPLPSPTVELRDDDADEQQAG